MLVMTTQGVVISFRIETRVHGLVYVIVPVNLRILALSETSSDIIFVYFVPFVHVDYTVIDSKLLIRKPFSIYVKSHLFMKN